MADTEFIGVPIHKDISTFEGKVFAGMTIRMAVAVAIAAVAAVILGVLLMYVAHLDFTIAALPIMLVCGGIVVFATKTPGKLSMEEKARLIATQYKNDQRLKSSSSSELLSDSFAGKRTVPLPEAAQDN